MLQSYLLLSILGYFGIKIINGAFKVIPWKSSQREILDFVTTLVLGGVLYSLNNMETRYLTSDWLYYLGFSFGLTMPFAKSTLSKEWQENEWMIYISVISIILFTAYITAVSQSGESTTLMSYMLYLLVLGLVVAGLIFTKTEPKKIPVTVGDNPDNKGIHETAGQYVNINFTMVAWLVSLLFVADSENEYIQPFISFLQGCFYGAFVGGMSMYGIEYLLEDTEPRQCDDPSACKIKGMVIDDKPYENLTSQITTLRWVIILTLLILMVMIALFYASASF